MATHATDYHDGRLPIATSTPDNSQYLHNEHHAIQGSVRSVDEGIMEEYSEKPPPPPRRRFYKQKRYWIICSILTVIIVVVAVLLIVFVFFPMIAQHIMNQAGIDVEGADITFSAPNDNLSKRQVVEQQPVDMNSTFYMKMTSKLTNTGPFSADIVFHNPINVYYNETLLGTVTLPDTHVSGGSGKLEAVTPFEIQDPEYFALFTKDMLAQENFIWKMKGKLDITALSRTATVDLDKEIHLLGMNGFPEVKITSFELPGDAPQGGIIVNLGTQLTSPSPIGVQLGTIALQIGYEGVNLGQVVSEGVTLKQGPNDLMLKGVLTPQANPADLEKVGVLFSNYVAGKMSMTSATGVSASPNGKDTIGWLSEGFKSVKLNVGLGLEQPLSIIKGVSMGYLDMTFTPDAPYSPVTTAPAVVADFSIPFGFSLNITEVSQELKLGTNDTGDFASISVPYVPAQSDQAAGKLQFAMNNATIQGLEGKENQFNDFTFALTASDLYSFQVGGNASTKTSTPIGNIVLSGISFEVPTSLHGLQFLNSTPTVINGVDVTGGTSENLLLSINVTMENPADFSISTGDVNFAFLASTEQLGNVQLSNLKLNRGSNSVTASSTFDPKKSPVGQNLLSTFVMGQNNDVAISGFDGSTAIASLAGALGAITIDTTLPGLQSKLVQGSKLTVLPSSPQDGIVNVQVSLANPFSAGLTITTVKSSVTYKGMPVGNIDQDISGQPFIVAGHTTAESAPLQMTMNIEPAAVALLLRTLALDANLDTRPLDAMLGMGGFSIAGMDDVAPDSSLFNGFNISSYVMDAMKILKADLQLSSGLTIGEYQNDLAFSQSDVGVQTGEDVTLLIPIVGQPIVQQIVDGAELAFETIILSEPSDTAFKVQMKGSITNAGPMDAAIAFPEPLTVYWEGKELGKVSMPTINSKADVGAQFDVTGQMTVADQGTMGDFAGYMINNKDFKWNIRTGGVAVTALGFTFTGISMDKYVTLLGCNGFKDAVTINSFNLPSNDPDGGITLTADTTINNPSQVGFSLSGASFKAVYKEILLGPLASDGPANFAPKAASNIKMKGRLIPQDTDEGLKAVTEVFENYLAAKDTLINVLGESGSGPGGVVGWLTAGFKTIKIENVVMPGPETPPELIPAITMKNMQMDFTKDPYAPTAGSTQVEAQLKNPFGFPLGVSQLNMDVIAGKDGTDMASLKIPDEKATTSSTGLVTTQFSGVPFKVYDDKHPLFDGFVKLLTSQGNVTFELAGSSNAITDTAIGSLKLNNITFDVDTSLAGFNNFGGKTDILSLAVTGATKEYIIVSLKISMTNPSQITIKLGGMKLNVFMNEFNAQVGDATLKDVTIVPGENQMDAEMHMYSTNEKALGQLLSNYMTGAQVPLSVKGFEGSTDIASLKDGLSTVNLATTMVGIKDKLVVDAVVNAGLDAILAKKAQTQVTLYNPIDTTFTLISVKADIHTQGKSGYFKVGSIDYTLDSPMTVNAKESAQSANWPVTVESDIGQLLELLTTPDLKIDIQQNVTIRIGGGDGFTGGLFYYQDQVPCKINLDILGLAKNNPGNATTDALPADVVSQLPDNMLKSLGISKPEETPAASPEASASASSGTEEKAKEDTPAATTPAPSSNDDAKESSSDDSAKESSSAEESSDASSGGDDKPGFSLWPFKL
ncbi:hypothetical protein BDA99DRAFT_113950 [Phascolomyces articulosus]|uniref:Uncharacterized protein n=1 Tax=Phascolomyces articulosus TaxID=60185 RepID=A0AAD5PC59_9FUNG|nr:hypothetical protein BDA99DRAFT_113950 [Phascolomyces articulosus]